MKLEIQERLPKWWLILKGELQGGGLDGQKAEREEDQRNRRAIQEQS